jgi:hypothetical protein
MIKIIGVIIGVIFRIGGIIFGAAGVTIVLNELEAINETVAAGIYAIIFGLAFLAIGNCIIKSIIKE